MTLRPFGWQVLNVMRWQKVFQALDLSNAPWALCLLVIQWTNFSSSSTSCLLWWMFCMWCCCMHLFHTYLALGNDATALVYFFLDGWFSLSLSLSDTQGLSLWMASKQCSCKCKWRERERESSRFQGWGWPWQAKHEIYLRFLLVCVWSGVGMAWTIKGV